jgi:hypothetical protein
MKRSAFIGIDPGKTGAAVLLSSNEYRLWDWVNVFHAANMIRNWLDVFDIKSVLLENPSAGIPGQRGTKGVASVRTNFGEWRGLLVALLPDQYSELKAGDWKRGIVPPGPGDSKEKARQAAIKLFPGAYPDIRRKKDHNRAEALLIAYKCKQLFELNERRV